jgi:hypothetical protein
MNELEDLFDLQEPNATFHDGDLLSFEVDYRTRELVARWNLFVGASDAPEKRDRERQREGRLRLQGLLFWVVEPPNAPTSKDGTPWLTADGPLSECPTAVGKGLALSVPPGAVGWYLFFSDWNAFAYCGAESARFEWA